MFRRRFLQRITLAGASGLAATRTTQASSTETVIYRIEGFSCITCAIGLETMLRRQKGIARAEASYPKANVVIEFDPRLITEQSLRVYVAEMGFSAESEGAGK